MLDAFIRAFLVVGGISAVAAWTWPGMFPQADPVAVLVRYHTPNVYTAVVAWYYVAPGVAAYLIGQFLISRCPRVAGRRASPHADRHRPGGPCDRSTATPSASSSMGLAIPCG